MVRERGCELEGHAEVESQEENDREPTERKQEERDLGWRVNEIQQSLRADYSSLNKLAPSILSTPPSPPPPPLILLTLTTTSHNGLLFLSLQPQVPACLSNSACVRKVRGFGKKSTEPCGGNVQKRLHLLWV